MGQNSESEHSSVAVPRLYVAPSQEHLPGVDLLTPFEKVYVKQQLEQLETHCGYCCEGRNRYEIQDVHGRPFMRAQETTCCCCVKCCCCCCIGNGRPFRFTIDDYEGNEFYLYRKGACNTCFCPCCLNKLTVKYKDGRLMGSVKQSWSLFKTHLYIRDENDVNLLQVIGPCCTSSCCGDVNFTIHDMKGEDVGRIAKKWSGMYQETFEDADNYGLFFPKDLTNKVKATLVATAILIDFMYFEKNEPSKAKKKKA